MKKIAVILLAFLLFHCSSDDSTNPTNNLAAETLYFPPNNSNIWETTSPTILEWNTDELNNLYTYLEEKNTKSFIILKNGRIAVEYYLNGHTQNDIWPWYSAVKSLTATSIGIAQDEGLIDINNKTSDYLGNNWSSLTQEQQDAITVEHHLNMTTGLRSNPANIIAWSCIAPACMIYDYDAGNVWQYHQGGFTQLQHILTQASGMDFKSYIEQNILDRIGMNGSWNSVLDLNIFSSDARSMARFGLLAMNEGQWNDEVLLSSSYFQDMTNSSQNLNQSYGYLWWLNGKNSFVGTDSQLYSSEIVPNAPDDMFAALGAQDQKIYVVPSLDMVIIRQGNTAGIEEVLANSSFDNELWEKINAVIQ